MSLKQYAGTEISHGNGQDKCVHLPELNLRDDEIRLLLAMKLLEDGLVSLGKAAEVVGFSEKAFAEILLQRGMPQ